MDATTSELRDLVASTRPSARSAGYPSGVRERVVAHVLRARAEGTGWGTLGTALGVSATTLQRWCEGRGGEGAGFVPVKVDSGEEPAAQTLPSEARPALALVSPRGFRVEGLGFEDLVRLLQVLG